MTPVPPPPVVAVRKYDREADHPAYEMLPDRYDDPHRRSGGPDAGDDIF
jgi:hypothetical protein